VTPPDSLAPRRRNSLKAIFGGLLAAKHTNGLVRWTYSYLTRSDIPLPASTKPVARPARSRQGPSGRANPLVLMAGPTLNADGAPLSQFELAAGLSGSGIGVEIAAAVDGALHARYQQQSIPVSIPPELSCNLFVPAWYEADVQRLADLLRQRRLDLVMASTVDVFPLVDAARIAGIPSVWNIRESEPWRIRLSHLHPLIASRALACFSYPEAVIFVARASQAAWSAFVPPERAHVIYNAPHPSLLSAPTVEPKIPSAIAATAGKTLIINVGTLCERKGQLDLAQALSTLPPDVLQRLHVAFIGRSEGDYQANLQRALSPAAATVCVFPGPVNGAAEIIRAADILVHTARSEAFPRVLLEAAVMRTPIIATAVDGAPERLTDGESALLYKPGDTAALADALCRLLAEPDLRDRLQAGAYDGLVASYTFEDMLKAYRVRLDAAIAAR